jgi:hypothetical protein
MALATTVEILQAMAGQLEDSIQANTDFDVHIEPMWFPIAEMPAIDMFPTNPTGLEDGLAGFGSETRYGAVPIMIRARVGMADGEAGQELLYGLMDEIGLLSIVAALDADRTLGGVCDSLTWGFGYPWAGVAAYLDANGDGTLAGSEMKIVVVKTQS